MYEAIGALVFLLLYFTIAYVIIGLVRLAIPAEVEERIFRKLGLYSDSEYED